MAFIVITIAKNIMTKKKIMIIHSLIILPVLPVSVMMFLYISPSLYVFHPFNSTCFETVKIL